MSPEQTKVLRGMGAGLVATLALLAAAVVAAPALSGALDARRASALGAVLLAAPLAACVSRVAAARFFGPGIDGGAAPDDAGLDLGRRILANTLEQTMLAALAFAGLRFALAPPWDAGALVYASGFVAARAAFAIGYARAGHARAFGFAATFYPTLAALILAAAGAAVGG